MLIEFDALCVQLLFDRQVAQAVALPREIAKMVSNGHAERAAP